MVIDQLVSAQVVLANGDIVIASEKDDADLFWAIRGGGSNFGPITSFTFKAFPQTGDVWSGYVRNLSRPTRVYYDLLLLDCFPGHSSRSNLERCGDMEGDSRTRCKRVHHHEVSVPSF
jgi:hypothetical protein